MIVAAAFFLLWSRRRARGDAELDSKHSQRAPLHGSDGIFEMEDHPRKDVAVHQYSAPVPIYEAASSQQPALQELDANNYHGEAGDNIEEYVPETARKIVRAPGLDVSSSLGYNSAWEVTTENPNLDYVPPHFVGYSFIRLPKPRK